MQDASGPRRKDPRPDDYGYAPFVSPELTPERYRAYHKAAKVHAEYDRSDPFAYGRAMLYLKRGILNPDDLRSGPASRPPE
jgi:hypothetical protein